MSEAWGYFTRECSHLSTLLKNSFYPSKLEYLEEGLTFLLEHYKKAGITSIAFPKLGAQNGKLSWDDVGPLMAKYLSQMDVDVFIYIAEGDREYQYDAVTERKMAGQYRDE